MTMTNKKISAAIVGGTGYTGVELIRLLSAHPHVQIGKLTSRSQSGTPVCEVFPSLRGVSDLIYSDFNDDTIAQLCAYDVVFFATPHGVAMQHAKQLSEAGVKIIDLAADFRLQSLDEFKKWYKQPHACPQLLKQAVYGLVEVNRESIKQAQIIGNPGCYPTTAILGVAPIFIAQRQSETMIEPTIIIDAKSGVSGAGRQAALSLNFAETSDNLKAYGVQGHRHLPEIEQGIRTLSADNTEYRVRFVPHLVPMIRGMLTTIHLSLTEFGCTQNIQALFEQTYASEPFVDVLPTGVFPDTRSVRASNRLRLALHQDNAQKMLTIVVVQDNLVKGAAGQAVQCLNLMFGLPETDGLNVTPVVP